MRTVRTKVYQFSELSKDAQKKALQWYENILNNDPDILDGFDECCAEKAAEYGFKEIKLQYSLSYCQGDGLSFSCDNFDLKAFLTNNTRLHKTSVINVLAANLTYEIKGNKGRYAFASRSDVDLYLSDNVDKEYPNIESFIPDLKKDLQDIYMQLCKELENIGYIWLQDAFKEENMIEAIEDNEYEFTKEGNRF